MIETTRPLQGRNWSDDDEDDWNFEDHMRAHGHEVAPTAEDIGSLKISQGRNWSDDDEDDWNFEDHMRVHGHEVAPTTEDISSLQFSQAIPDSFDELTTTHTPAGVRLATVDKRPEVAVETKTTQVSSLIPEEPADLGGLEELPPSKWGLEVGHQGPQMSVDFWFYVHFNVVANFAQKQTQKRQKDDAFPAYPELSTCNKGQYRINYCSNWRDLKVLSSGGQFHHSYQYLKSGLGQELRFDDDEVVEKRMAQEQETVFIDELDLARFEFSDSRTDSEDSCSTEATSPALSENGEEADVGEDMVAEIECSAEEPEVYIEKGIGFPLSIEQMSLLHSALEVEVAVALANEDFLEVDLVKKIKDVDFPGLGFNPVYSSPPPLDHHADTLEDDKENIDDSPIRIVGLQVPHKDETDTADYTMRSTLVDEACTSFEDDVDAAGIYTSDSLPEADTSVTINDTTWDRSYGGFQVPYLIIENDSGPTKQALDATPSTEDAEDMFETIPAAFSKHIISSDLVNSKTIEDSSDVTDSSSTNSDIAFDASKAPTPPSDTNDKTQTADQQQKAGCGDAPPAPISAYWSRIKLASRNSKLPATTSTFHTIGSDTAAKFAKPIFKLDYKATGDSSIMNGDSDIDDEDDYDDILEAFEATHILPQYLYTDPGLPSSSYKSTLLDATAPSNLYSRPSPTWKAAAFIGAAAVLGSIYYARRRS